MNNKGFAVTTMVYTAIILLAMAMFSVLGIKSNEYNNQRDFVDDVNQSLNDCIGGGSC